MVVERGFKKLLPKAPEVNPDTPAAPESAAGAADSVLPAGETGGSGSDSAVIIAAVESVPDHETVTGGGEEPGTDSTLPERAEDAPAEAAEADQSGQSEEPAAPARPHYSQLVRKELRVFKDQSVDLKVLTLTINANRVGPGERITDNTLVRVAIDLLLQRKDELSGTTEAELRSSLNLAPRY